MKKLVWFFLGMLTTLPFVASFGAESQAEPQEVSYYGARVCSSGEFKCQQIKAGQTWRSLFPDEHERDVIKRINRMNIALQPGMVIAVPHHHIHALSGMEFSPFAYRIMPPGKKLVVVSPKELAWGAYTAQGRLINWGPISAGQSYCADVGEDCKTPAGKYHVFQIRGSDCKSHEFPVATLATTAGGAPMPYCMFFNGGRALHGSPGEVPGFNASHGCVRMFVEDARWLNEDFVTLGGSTQVVVLPYL